MPDLAPGIPKSLSLSRSGPSHCAISLSYLIIWRHLCRGLPNVKYVLEPTGTQWYSPIFSVLYLYSHCVGEQRLHKYPGAEGKAQPGGNVGWLCLEAAVSLALVQIVI